MVEKKELDDKPKEKANKGNFWLFVGLIAVVGIIVIILISSGKIMTGNVVAEGNNLENSQAKGNCREVQVPYEDIETYTESMPFTDEECENTPLKYLVEWENGQTTCINEICDQHESVCVDKNFWGNCVQFEERCTHNACTKYSRECVVNVNNIDNEGGSWAIDGYSWNNELNQKGDFIGKFDAWVNPTRSNTVRWSFTYNAGESRSCWYQVAEVPTKTVCDNVINYRDVEKTRTVVKYKTETQCD